MRGKHQPIVIGMSVHNLQHWADETDSSSVDESHTPTAWVRRTQYTPRVHLGLHLKIQCTPDIRGGFGVSGR